MWEGTVRSVRRMVAGLSVLTVVLFSGAQASSGVPGSFNTTTTSRAITRWASRGRSWRVGA